MLQLEFFDKDRRDASLRRRRLVEGLMELLELGNLSEVSGRQLSELLRSRMKYSFVFVVVPVEKFSTPLVGRGGVRVRRRCPGLPGGLRFRVGGGNNGSDYWW